MRNQAMRRHHKHLLVLLTFLEHELLSTAVDQIVIFSAKPKVKLRPLNQNLGDGCSLPFLMQSNLRGHLFPIAEYCAA